RSRIGGEAGLKNHARLCIFKARDLLLQLHVDFHGAGDGADRARTDAVFSRGLEGRFAQLGMRGQAQVIVRSEINDALAVEGALRRLFVLKYTQAKIGALGLEIIQLFGEIRKRIGSSSSGHEALRAESSLNDRSRPSP